MRFKQPQTGTKLNLKPTPKSKRNKTKEKHKKGGHLQRWNDMVSLENEASKRVSILDMPSKAT